MGKLIDKTIILILLIFAATDMARGGMLSAMIFASVIVICVNHRLWLMKGDLRCFALTPDIVAAVLPFYDPGFIILLPFIAYDTATYLKEGGRRRGILTITGAVSFAAGLLQMVAAAVSNDIRLPIVLFVSALTAVAVFRSINTSRVEALAKDYLKIQDAYEVRKDILKQRNNEIMEAHERELRMGTLAERNRIAREIHDNVGHMLSRAILMVGAMRTVHKEDDVGQELTVLQETLDSAMNNIRKSVHDIRDDSVDLSTTIRDMSDPLRLKYDVRLDIDDSEKMPGQIKYAISAICKECISNITKYSRNDTVSITVNTHPAFYQLEVHDYMVSGRSEMIDMSKVGSSTGMGIAGITKRAEELGGRASFSGNNGFRVFVVLPRSNNKEGVDNEASDNR